MSLPFSDQTLILTGSLALLWGSRRALVRPRSHGFARFFAAELILLLLVRNRNPVGDQTIAQILLALSLALLVLGFMALRAHGRPGNVRGDEALFGFERTTTLVTGSIFRFIRHPMYASLLTLAWAFFFRDPSPAAFGLAAAASVLLDVTARADERECLAYFGEAYAEYMRRTRRFVPYVF